MVETQVEMINNIKKEERINELIDKFFELKMTSPLTNEEKKIIDEASQIDIFKTYEALAMHYGVGSEMWMQYISLAAKEEKNRNYPHTKYTMIVAKNNLKNGNYKEARGGFQICLENGDPEAGKYILKCNEIENFVNEIMTR